jgi:hypothetical protein
VDWIDATLYGNRRASTLWFPRKLTTDIGGVGRRAAEKKKRRTRQLISSIETHCPTAPVLGHQISEAS